MMAKTNKNTNEKVPVSAPLMDEMDVLKSLMVPELAGSGDPEVPENEAETEMPEPKVADLPSGTRVFVGGINDSIKNEDLATEFKKYGSVNSFWISLNPPGFGVIEFVNRDDAIAASANLNGAEVLGCTLKVEILSGGRGRARDRVGGFTVRPNGPGDFQTIRPGDISGGESRGGFMPNRYSFGGGRDTWGNFRGGRGRYEDHRPGHYDYGSDRYDGYDGHGSDRYDGYDGHGSDRYDGYNGHGSDRYDGYESYDSHGFDRYDGYESHGSGRYGSGRYDYGSGRYDYGSGRYDNYDSGWNDDDDGSGWYVEYGSGRGRYDGYRNYDQASDRERFAGNGYYSGRDSGFSRFRDRSRSPVRGSHYWFKLLSESVLRHVQQN